MAKPTPSLQDFFQYYFSTFVEGLNNAPTGSKVTLSSKLFSADLIAREARSELSSTDILQTIEVIVRTSTLDYATQKIADFLCVLDTQPATKGLAERFRTDFHQTFDFELPKPSEQALKAVAPAPETSSDHKVVHYQSDPCGKHSYDLQFPTAQTGTAPSYYYLFAADVGTHPQFAIGGYSQEVGTKISRSEPSNAYTLHSNSITDFHPRKMSLQDKGVHSAISSVSASTLINESGKSLVSDQLHTDIAGTKVHGQQETAQGAAGSAVVPSPPDFQSQLSERAELANPHKSYINTQVCGTGAGLKDCCSCVPMELHQQVCEDRDLFQKQNTKLTEENSKLQNKIGELEKKVAELKWLIDTKDNFAKQLEERLIDK